MNQITEIIEATLDEHRDAGTHHNPALAEAIAQRLINASLEQLATLLAGNLNYDDDGRIVVQTGLFDENQTLDARVANSWDRA
jgi:hypothetical protein